MAGRDTKAQWGFVSPAVVRGSTGLTPTGAFNALPGCAPGLRDAAPLARPHS